MKAHNLLFLTACLLLAPRYLFASEWPVEAKSQTGNFQLTLAPESGQITLSRYHNWLVTVKTYEGVAVADLGMVFTAGMPAHAHGMLSAPQVKSYLGSGIYRVEGVKFHMPGQWLVRILLVSEGGTKILYETTIDVN